MQGVSVITDSDGQPAVLTIDLNRLDPTDSPLVAALLDRLKTDDDNAPVIPYETAENFEQERREFLEASMISLNRAYGDDEPEYTIDDCIWINPDFKPHVTC